MKGRENLHSIDCTTKQVCEKCGEEKTLIKKNFYFKKDRGDFDKTCADCRKSARSNRYKIQNKVAIRSFPVPQESSKEITPNISKPLDKSDMANNDLSDLFSFFEILKGWRDELREEQPEKFNKKWEVFNV